MALPSPLPGPPTPSVFDTWTDAVTDTAADHESRIDVLEADDAGDDTAIALVQTNLDAHIADTTAAHAASAVSNTPAGGIAATTVQAALNELDTEKATIAYVDSQDVNAYNAAVGTANASIIAYSQPLDADLTALASAGNSAVLAATTASFLTADETKLDALPSAATYASDLAGKQPLDSDLTALAAAGNSAVLSATTASFLTAQDTKLNALPDNATLTASLAAKAANLDDFRYLDHGLWIPQANVTNPTDHVGTGGSGAMAGWSLAAASTLRHLVTTFIAPPGWAGMAIDLYWLNNGAGSGSVRWRVDVVSTVLGASTTATVSTVQQTITALAQNLPKQESGYSTGVAVDNTKIYRISVIRDASNVVDTLGNAVLFMGLGLRRTS